MFLYLSYPGYNYTSNIDIVGHCQKNYDHLRKYDPKISKSNPARLMTYWCSGRQNGCLIMII